MKKLHLICNAHLDPVWQWTRDEGMAAAISTFRSAADLCDEFDYIFCHNESLLYEAIENYAPELFERIKALVKKGKWQIIGGWYVQPDCNMPCGESFVRQIKTGQKYFAEKFGVTPTVACNFDSFGHSVGLTQILKKCGYNGYIISRPDESGFGGYPGRFFEWEGPDGSKVIVSRISSYGSGLGHALEKIKNNLENSEDIDVVLWGVGNHGGGPSRKDLGDIAAFKPENAEIFHSTPENLFGDNIRISGNVKRSLVTSMPGCYTSMMKVKQAHRQTENIIYSTEKMITAASLAGCKFDEPEQEKAIKKLLFSEFHDILPGSSVPEGEKDGLEMLSTAAGVFKDMRTKAVMYLTMGEKSAADGEYPIFVFNFMPYEITCPVEAEFTLADQNWSEDIVYIPEVYSEGKKIPSQLIKEIPNLNLDWRKRIIFEGKLKPMGVTRFSVRTVCVPNPKKGDIPVDGTEVFKSIKYPASLVMYDDSADPWAMSEAEKKVLGKNPVTFREMTNEECADFCKVPSLMPCHIIENGDIYTGIECFSVCGNTRAVTEYRIYKNQPFTDIKVTLEYGDKNKLVRLKLPVGGGQLIGDGPFVIESKGNNEVTFQKWLGKEKDGQITAVINDGIYGGKGTDDGIELTLLRGSGYLMHPIGDRQLYKHDRYMPRIESGRYVYNFRIFTGDASAVTRAAEEFNQSPYALNLFPIGSGEKKADIHLSKPVSMPVCRTFGGKTVMRFYNPESFTDSFDLTVQGTTQQISMPPHAVVSAVYSEGKFEVHTDDMPL